MLSADPLRIQTRQLTVAAAAHKKTMESHSKWFTIRFQKMKETKKKNGEITIRIERRLVYAENEWK